jgi:hypothetical protein
MSEGLKDEDLLGLVDVTLKKPPIKSRSMPDTLVFIVEYRGKEYRVGVIGQAAFESVKKHGYKDANGQIHLRIPSTALREKGAGWINEPY